jgi:hypothetical protein
MVTFRFAILMDVRPAPVLLLVCVVAALATAALASAARPGPVEDGTLSVRDGRATIQLRVKGGVIGRLGSGKLTVTRQRGDTSTVVVRGWDRSWDTNARTTVYTGRNIRFRIDGDRRVTLKIHGSKINFSAVGRGDAALDGWGDPAKGVYFDGSYSLNGAPYKSLPDVRETLELVAAPTDS